jgi:hypothetical protein
MRMRRRGDQAVTLRFRLVVEEAARFKARVDGMGITVHGKTCQDAVREAVKRLNEDLSCWSNKEDINDVIVDVVERF